MLDLMRVWHGVADYLPNNRMQTRKMNGS